MAYNTKMRVSNGLIREEEYQAMKLALENAEWDLKRSFLNLDEVKISGDIPRNELYAPMVGGRDFVSERLTIEKKEVELVLEQLRIHLERVKQLVEKNVARGNEVDQIQAEIANRNMMINKIQERIDLRARFLTGEITAQEVEIKERMIGAERNLQISQSRVESLKEQLERLKIFEAQGKVSHMEVIQLEYALDAAQAELKLATLEMDVLEKLK